MYMDKERNQPKSAPVICSIPNSVKEKKVEAVKELIRRYFPNDIRGVPIKTFIVEESDFICVLFKSDSQLKDFIIKAVRPLIQIPSFREKLLKI
jgi:hypothetical protein